MVVAIGGLCLEGEFMIAPRIVVGKDRVLLTDAVLRKWSLSSSSSSLLLLLHSRSRGFVVLRALVRGVGGAGRSGVFRKRREERLLLLGVRRGISAS